MDASFGSPADPSGGVDRIGLERRPLLDHLAERRRVAGERPGHADANGLLPSLATAEQDSDDSERNDPDPCHFSHAEPPVKKI
jgi:hypothetical protein